MALLPIPLITKRPLLECMSSTAFTKDGVTREDRFSIADFSIEMVSLAVCKMSS